MQYIYMCLNFSGQHSTDGLTIKLAFVCKSYSMFVLQSMSKTKIQSIFMLQTVKNW